MAQLNPASLVISTPDVPKTRAVDFSKIVVPITELKFLGVGVEGKFGTGFCLDPECSFVVSNYHVAIEARPRKIKGQKIVHLYLATGPKDVDATVVDAISARPAKYTSSRDLAIYELSQPLADHYGVSFDLDDLEPGQRVDIYAYPKENISPMRSLVRFEGAFSAQTPNGLLAFAYRPTADKTIRPGASGGIVVDRQSQKIVGILNGIAKDGQLIATAVPIQSLADFVSEVQPELMHRIFSSAKYISPDSTDFYPKFSSPPQTEALQHRSEESAEIKALRAKAQLLADNLRNFIALQTFAWGSGNKPPSARAAYEVQVLGGYQRFRRYPDGKTEYEDVPFPALNNAINPGGEWAELPEMVGTKLGLKIQQAPDVVVNERKLKVFQFRADSEDGICKFKSILDFVFFTTSKSFNPACYGEVWTDEDLNILRMSKHLEIPDRWTDLQVVVTYGWIPQTDAVPTVAPLTIATIATLNKKIYWCRGRFSNYRRFESQVRVLTR